MAREATEVARDTRAQILDVAERLVQRRGYNGFSYAVVAAEVGVTKGRSPTTSRASRSSGRR